MMQVVMSEGAAPKLSWRYWRDPEVVLVCGLGSGFAPKAPGTFGSLAAVAIWWWWLAALPVLAQLLVAVGVFALGTWLTRRVMRRHGVRDDGAIVVDEFVGQWLALLAVAPEIWTAAAGFGLFRLFDIAKPWPVRSLERRVPGALGVMVDDVAAGLMAAGVLQITVWLVAYATGA